MPATRRSRQASTAPPRPAVQQNGVDKRERILSAAEDLFYRNGLVGTTMDMLCAELGVTKPYVYYYFKDKHEIVETLAWRASLACLTTMKFPADDARPAAEKLAEGLQRWVSACVAHFRASALAFRVTASLRPEFRAELRRLANEFYADLGTLMEEGRREGRLDFEDAAITAKAMGGVVGFMYTWYRPDGRLPSEQLASQLTGTLYRMIGLRPTAPKCARKRTPPKRKPT
ncbi:MAG: TetR/AcrR family transcriptional regulator [Rhodocyclales bacterium]|nr:TetR/AcrR family transcriptional regulator [Rhodocyclales bacterium]